MKKTHISLSLNAPRIAAALLVALQLCCGVCLAGSRGAASVRSAEFELRSTSESEQTESAGSVPFEGGQQALARKEYAAAYRLLRTAAERGHVGAQSLLGDLCLAGQGVPASATEAARWYRMAAEQDDLLAELNLGLLLRDGKGVGQDDAEAALWLRKSAEGGNSEAHAYIGLMYQEGRGVPQDDAEAMQWLLRGAELGDAYAQHMTGVSLAEGRGIAQDADGAREWLASAARQGFVMSREYLLAKWNISVKAGE